ncbi:MAG: putative Lipopolysaccharide heptosyltransferase, Glycosyl transferase, family 9 [Bradyrhizobium sp.]|nr:putative Lipopolysaccharide heptosyltransferase, Glycosyl transferase, family 9 [Bradyrhizobium sp.]
MSAAAWATARRILCVRLDNLGDVLMMTPAFHALKRAVPGRRLTLLASAAGAQAGALIPDIAATIAYEAPWTKRSPGTAHGLPARLPEIGGCQFDAAVIFTCFSQSPLPAALMCSLAGIPLRLAFCRENPYGLLSDWLPETEPETGIRHEVRRQLDLVAYTGARAVDNRMRLSVPTQARTGVAGVLHALDINAGAPWVVLHAGATAPSRRYSPMRFVEAARTLAREDGLQVLLTGGAAEYEDAAAMTAAIGPGAFNLAGRLSLAELAALIEGAKLLISNNSGPVHVAACVGTPVVDLYALTNPQHTPWEVPSRVLFHDVPCKYCFKSACPQGHHRCLDGVPAADVLRAARELLSGSSAGKTVLEAAS